MRASRILSLLLLVGLALVAWGGWWTVEWIRRGPVASSGGLYFLGYHELYIPQFRQADARWGTTLLGSTPATFAAEGCAVSSAAMVLASYGMDVDPGRLNAFLTKRPGGYTPEGWIYWEKAAEFDFAFTERLLPHYEDLPSYFLIDRNLLAGNPVISLPFMAVDGLPLGLELQGFVGEEESLIASARALDGNFTEGAF